MLHLNNTDKQQLPGGKGTPRYSFFFIFLNDRARTECMNVSIKRGKKVIPFSRLEEFFCTSSLFHWPLEREERFLFCDSARR